MSGSISSSTDVSRSIQYISSSSEETVTSLTFKVRLYHDYRQTAWLPKVTGLDHAAEWIIIATPHGRQYKIQIADNDHCLLLQRGWALLAAVENLQEGDKLLFKIESTNNLSMSIHSPANHAPPIGLSPGRLPPADENAHIEQVIINQGVTRNAVIDEAIRKVWNASSIDGPIYVCHLLISPIEGPFLIFNKTYTSVIPREKATVAMRFVGSNMIIPGAIKTYRDGNARMVKEWPLYAAHHYLTLGEIFICKIHRGPSVWEFVGSCVPS